MTQDLQFALEMAELAGEETLKYFGKKNLKVEKKGDESPVTIADRNTEHLIRDLLKQKYPKDAVLGEEFGVEKASNSRKWVIDPIDGTKSFIHGVPLYGVLIGLEIEQTIQVGVVNFPALKMMYYAERGYGAYKNYSRISVSDVSDLSQATMAFTDGDFLTSLTDHPLDKVVNEVGLLRGWGDCYAHMLVASGQADLVVEPEMSPWDCAAIIPIVSEAGGMCFDYTGKTTIYGQGLISANKTLGEQLFLRTTEKN
jgi:myo-inositol-1(or 4)-monophosphatase